MYVGETGVSYSSIKEVKNMKFQTANRDQAMFKKSLIVALGAMVVALSGCDSKEEKANQAAIQAGQKLAEKGRDAIPGCVACHGAHGEGIAAAGYPRLAGLNAGYIEKQLKDLARELPPAGVAIEAVAKDYSKTPRIYSDLTVFSPGLRHDDIMSPIAKQLSVADIHNLAVYYASLSYTAIPVAADYQVLERGQDLALRGKAEYGLPACVSCHAPDGEGFGADFPPLAGQPSIYIVNQINKWQQGQRDNDNLGLMKAVADQLTDADKLNVAAYYANRSLTVKGQQ
ncbi:MAG: c-type cytochrome [Sulfuriferula sp.]|nr:c-type cytochrome [Sulfuriferula sp.]